MCEMIYVGDGRRWLVQEPTYTPISHHSLKEIVGVTCAKFKKDTRFLIHLPYFKLTIRK